MTTGRWVGPPSWAQGCVYAHVHTHVHLHTHTLIGNVVFSRSSWVIQARFNRLEKLEANKETEVTV